MSIRRLRDTVTSKEAPLDDNVLWIDISVSNAPVMKFKLNGEWVELSGGGGKPVVTPDLKVSYYYGASVSKITPSNVIEAINNLAEASKRTAYTNMNAKYHYIILYKDYRISSVITNNNENITSSFTKTGSFTKEELEYYIYEFSLSSGLPLDVAATINIIGE